MPNKVKVTIKGKGMGILFNNPMSSAQFNPELKESATLKKAIYNHDEEAEARLYWTPDGKSIAYPAWHIFTGLIKAASGAKLPSNKKKPLSPVIAGDVTVSPDMIPFGTKAYTVDIRRAVVNRQGILRARPCLKEWELTFYVEWEDQYLGKDFGCGGPLRELLETLGGSIGIGDFRPEKRGPFGRFEVVEIKKI